MNRMLAPQQITWFLDLKYTEQINLNPPYQRKSIWNLKDREYFLDSIFRNFPCPTIYIYKEINKDGKITHNVVDGKQRLDTIFMFKNNEISISKKYGDSDYNGKTYNKLADEQKKKFWDYTIPVDFIDVMPTGVVNEIFGRLNTNLKNLNEQQQRHGKYDGWFATEVEYETGKIFWGKMKINTKSKAKRMDDIQFVSELLMVILEKKIVGFDQSHITSIYADYDDLETPPNEIDMQQYISEKDRISKYVEEMDDNGNVITRWANTSNNFYTLWCLVALNKNKLPDASELAKKYDSFMHKVGKMNAGINPSTLTNEQTMVFEYSINSKGTSTDLKSRIERYDILKKVLFEIKNS